VAGDIDESAAQALADRLTQRLPKGHRPSSPIVALPGDDRVVPEAVINTRRLIIVDKPDRTQAQIRIGHPSLRYGDPDTAALAIAEAVFGGMFSSRLMQEIRVKRGWSYGAGCALRRSRLPHWFEIWMAAGIDVAGPAVGLTLELYADY